MNGKSYLKLLSVKINEYLEPVKYFNLVYPAGTWNIFFEAIIAKYNQLNQLQPTKLTGISIFKELEQLQRLQSSSGLCQLRYPLLHSVTSAIIFISQTVVYDSSVVTGLQK